MGRPRRIVALPLDEKRWADIPKVRTEVLAAQQGLCALCKQPITGTGHLDHNHGYTGIGMPGEIRGVLHPECNRLVGRVENTLRWYKDKGRFWHAVRNLDRFLTETEWTMMGHPGKRAGRTKTRRKRKPSKRKTR